MQILVIFNTIFENIISKTPVNRFQNRFDKKNKGFNYIKTLKQEDFFPYKSIYIYSNRKSRYIVKKINCSKNNIYYNQLKNEVRFLRLLSTISRSTSSEVSVPIRTWSNSIKNTHYFAQLLTEGEILARFSKKKIIDGFDKSKKFLKLQYQNLNDYKKYNLPMRSKSQIILTFPIYAFITIIKEPKLFKTIIQLMVSFYKNIGIETKKTVYSISHRDLTPENILVHNGKYKIIDFEVARIGEEETDLALFPRFYKKYLDRKSIIEYINANLQSDQSRRAFIRLTIFYTMQFLSIGTKNERFYVEALSYLKLAFSEVITRIRFEPKYQQSTHND